MYHRTLPNSFMMNTKLRILIIFSLVLSVVLAAKPTNACPSTVIPTSTTIPAEETKVRFIVYYNGDLSAVMNDKDSYIKTFMDVHNLKLISTFKIDEDNSGFTLEPKEKLEFPTELARKISLIDNVLMIEVAYIPVVSES
jgi:hypothetical protein